MSGISRTRREQFLQKYPYCCFCGGSTATETEDHIPARSLFAGRQWPEGYVFPACSACNNNSSSDEQLIAWLSRIRIGRYRTPEQEKEFEKLSHEVHRRHPDIWNGIRQMSRVETRRLAKQVNLDRIETDELVYSIAIPAALMEAMNRYGIKLAKALHYLHSKRIVPPNGIVRAWSYTNTEILSSEVAEKMLRQLTNAPVVQRSNTQLGDQFNYRYAIVEEGEASAFWIGFSQSTAIFAVVFFDKNRYNESKMQAVLKAQS